MRFAALWGRLEPSSVIPRPGFDKNLNALRGLAAILVLISHLFLFNRLFGPWGIAVFGGRPPVLIFFGISGYVIALSNQQPFSPGMGREYWRRRAGRILPIYWIALALTCAATVLTGRPLPFNQWFSHVIFLENFEPYGNFRAPLLPMNGVFWTLNCEVVFYLVFLGIWRTRIRLAWLLGALVAVSVATWLGPHGLDFLGTYAAGFVFFVAGVVLAWKVPRKTVDHEVPILGLLLVLVATSISTPVLHLFAVLNWEASTLPWISLADFAMLPLVILLLAAVTGRRPARFPSLCLGCFLPVAVIDIGVIQKHHSFSFDFAGLGLVLGFLGCALVYRPVGSKLLSLCGWAGGISYALYLIHGPCLTLCGVTRYSGGFGAWWPRMGAAVILSFGLAALLEHIIQPALLPWFNRLWIFIVGQRVCPRATK